MKLNQNDPNPGIWFPWPWNKEAKRELGGVTLRTLTLRVRRKIDAKTVTEEKKFIEGETYIDRTVDGPLRTRLIYDYCIMEWTGLLDADGKDIPCNIETKEIIALDFPHIAEYLIKCLAKVDKLEAKRMEEAEKN